MATYRAVIFDMFDTLVNFNNQHLPLVTIEGQSFRSTSPYVYEVLKPLCGDVSFPDFARAFVGSYRAAEEIRTREHREISARERFRFLFARLQISLGPEAADLLEAGIAEHMRQLIRAMEFPASHRAVLDALGSRYRLGVLSNFDHTPTVELALASHAIRDRFDAVVVSAEVGWRKPRPEIFAETFARMAVGPSEAIFVGDTPEVDVLGARGVGMDVIWIDHGTKGLPPGTPPPTYTVSGFPDIVELL